MISIWQLIIMMALVGVLCISCFLVAAFFSFRLQKDPGTPFLKPPKGEVFSLDNFVDGDSDLPPEEQNQMPKTVSSRANEFVERMAEKLGGDDDGK